jgi:hypothetical protein
MSGIYFEGILENSKIQSIGSLFRRVTGSRWEINLALSPKQDKTRLTMSNAPVLVRRRVLNPTEDVSPAGYLITLTIQSTDDWQAKLLAEYPIQDAVRWMDRDEWCFYFLADDGVQIFLPQFELARVLFFQNGYLSRTALEPDCLNAEYDIQYSSSEQAQINILPSSGFPSTLLDDYGARRLLSWLLLDQDVRRSFESIGRYQKLNGYDKNGYRRWHFQFDPPKLHGVRLEVRGRFDQETKCMFVYEIAAVRNIRNDVPEVVDIFHPDFKEKVRGQGAGGVKPSAERPFDHLIDDDAEANGDHQPVALSAPSVVFEFAKPFRARKLAAKKQRSASGKPDEEVGNTASERVSVDEETVSGNLPGADWDMVLDETDDAHLYANKFECFRNMLVELSTRYGWVIESNQHRKLPQLPRCKKHLLSNGDPRCMAVVKLVSQGMSCHIIEVDTSDATNHLSTQILRFKSQNNLEDQLQKLEKKLLKSSLRWPNNLLIELCGEDGVAGVPHPKTESEDKGRLRPDSVSHWACRFNSRLMEMCGS